MFFLLLTTHGTMQQEEREKNPLVVNGAAIQQNFLRDFNFFVQTFFTHDLNNETRNALKELWTVETSWKGTLRWSSLDNLLQRCGYFLSINRDGLNRVDEEKTYCQCPVWLSGGGLPLTSQNNRKLVHFIDGFRQGVEFAIFRGLHLSLLALTIYQLYHSEHQKRALQCQKENTSKRLFQFLWNSDDTVLLGIFHEIFGSQSSSLSYLKYILFSTPIAYGILKGAWNVCNNNLSEADLDNLLTKEIANVQSGCFYDFFWWMLLPLHPLNQRVNTLVKNILWSTNITQDHFRNFYISLKNIALDGNGFASRGYTSIHLLGHLKNLIYGLNANDLNLKETGYHCEESLLCKAEAFNELKRAAELKTDSLQDFAKSLVVAPYASYLLWALGTPRSWTEATFHTTFKLTKLGAQAYFIYVLINAVRAAKACPLEPGVSLAGVEPWATELTEQCFNEFVRTFNLIPGQPTDTLVGNLDQYHFPICQIALDLSGRGLSWQAVYNITKALVNHNFTFNSFNVSGNSVNQPEAFEKIFPLLEGLKVLDLSNNGIMGPDIVGTLGETVGKLTTLERLNLALNSICYWYTDQNGTTGLQRLSSGLSRLINLTDLNLAQNGIGTLPSSYGDCGVLLAESLRHMPQLRRLNLRYNYIGQQQGETIVALGQSFRNITQLTFLDLGWNTCFGNNNGHFLLFVEGLKQLSHLTELDLSYNQIEGFENIDYLVSALSHLHALQKFRFLLQNTCITKTQIRLINQVLIIYTKAAPLSLDILETVQDIEQWCAALPTKTRDIDLSGKFCNPGKNQTKALMECLKRRNKIRSLNLSQNWFGNDGVEILGRSFQYFPELEVLNLSDNMIGNGAPTAISRQFGEDFQYLKSLKVVDFKNNHIDQNAGAKNPPHPAFSIAFSRSFKNLTRLEHLNMINNWLGAGGSIGTTSIGNEARHLNNLKTLQLGQNPIDQTDSNCTVALGQSFKYLPKLRVFDFDTTFIGYTNSDGVVSLARGLTHTHSLTTLNLGGSWIGFTGPEGPRVLLSALPSLLPHLDLMTLNLNGMTNFSWTNASTLLHLQERTSAAIASQCQSSRCFGEDISADPETKNRVKPLDFYKQLTKLGSLQASSGAYAPSSFWGEAAKGVSTIYRTLWEVAAHPEMQRIGWTVVGSKLAYATFQTWPLLATYAMLT